MFSRYFTDNHSIKTLPSYLLSSFIFISVIFLLFHISGFERVFEWNKSLRDAATGFAVFSLTAYTLREKLYSPLWCLSLFPYLTQLVIYAYVLIHANMSWTIDYDLIHPYFLLFVYESILTACFFAFSQNQPQKWRFSISVLYGIIVAASLLFAAIYLGYYLLYNDTIRAENMLPILQTNKKEAFEFISDRIGLPVLFSSLIFFVLLLPASFFCCHKTISVGRDCYSKIRILWIGMICILSIISIHKYIPSLFPISQTYGAFHYIHEMRRISQKHEQNISRFRIYTPVSEAMPQKLPGTVIVVIGESATRDRMKAFTPSYPSETTPWLSEMKETPYFYLMDKTYSCFPVTVPALSMFLYGRNQYDHRNIDDVANIIDVAHLSGYKTWWMSNQGKMSGEDSPIDFVAQNCDTEQRTPFPLGDDYQLLDFVKQLPKNENNFVIIHLMGSHIRYSDRTPPDFKGIDNPQHDKRTNQYDTTLLYTDHLLRDIYTYAKDHLNLQVMMYCSDHGENMERSHVASKNMTYDMVRIPFFIYLSPAYTRLYPDTAQALRQNEHKVFTNDLMYDTISGVLHLPNTDYEPKFDLSSSAYDLKPADARTKYGEWTILDDPDYK